MYLKNSQLHMESTGLAETKASVGRERLKNVFDPKLAKNSEVSIKQDRRRFTDPLCICGSISPGSKSKWKPIRQTFSKKQNYLVLGRMQPLLCLLLLICALSAQILFFFFLVPGPSRAVKGKVSYSSAGSWGIFSARSLFGGKSQWTRTCCRIRKG